MPLFFSARAPSWMLSAAFSTSMSWPLAAAVRSLRVVGACDERCHHGSWLSMRLRRAPRRAWRCRAMRRRTRRGVAIRIVPTRDQRLTGRDHRRHEARPNTHPGNDHRPANEHRQDAPTTHRYETLLIRYSEHIRTAGSAMPRPCIGRGRRQPMPTPWRRRVSVSASGLSLFLSRTK